MQNTLFGNVFILGDSYSTFEGYIPEKNVFYYNENGPYYLISHPEMNRAENDVCKAEQTWWYDISTSLGTLAVNDSWSATTICNTGYNGADNKDISFVARLDKRIAEGYFEKNKIDTVFLFGGTNDSWADAPLGNKVYADWTDEDLYCVLPAFSYLVNRLVSNVPDAKIYCIINFSLKDEIADFYEEVCNQNGVGAIRLGQLDTVYDHPTVIGMAQIKEYIMDYVEKN